MNFPARSRILILTAFISGVVTSSYAAEGDTVTALTTRQEVLEKGKTLLTAKTPATTSKDPFEDVLKKLGNNPDPNPNPDLNPDLNSNPNPIPDPPPNRSLLQSIALSLKPSGFIVLGGQPTILFGQKRVKAGGFLTITFEGKEYILEIVSIDRPNFTLRLNREEFTRPIK